VDACLGEIVAAAEETGFRLLITADHGNADRMVEADGSTNTAHTTNLVPMVLVGEQVPLRPLGKLADLAPYIYKGCLLYVGGKIRTRSWNGQDGVTHYQTEITGTVVQLLSPKREQQPQAPARASQGYSQPMPNFNPAPAPQPMNYQQPPVPQGYSPAPQMQAPMQPMADSSDPNGDLPF
jgi:hypothetical protein